MSQYLNIYKSSVSCNSLKYEYFFTYGKRELYEELELVFSKNCLYFQMPNYNKYYFEILFNPFSKLIGNSGTTHKFIEKKFNCKLILDKVENKCVLQFKRIDLESMGYALYFVISNIIYSERDFFKALQLRHYAKSQNKYEKRN